MSIFRASLGILFFCLVAWLLSSHKRRFPWRVFVFSLLLQLALAGVILGTHAGKALFQGCADFLGKFIGMADPGAMLVFGPLSQSEALVSAFGPDYPVVFGFAAKGLLALIFFAAFMAILYHLGIMQLLIWMLARVMSATMKVSGAESMAMAANVFVGQTEAPLVVRPYIKDMTRSELNALMTGGFATIAGTVLAIYLGFIGEEYGPHLLTASVMSAPAAFLMAKIMLPETETSSTAGAIPLKIERQASNVIEAAANGTQDGVKLAINVAAMLIAFMALVNLANWPIGWFGEQIGHPELSLSRMMGWVFAPAAWLMGVEGWHDSQLVGSLMGSKLAVTEFVAYTELAAMLPDPAAVDQTGLLRSDRSAAIAAYALCGFANFASIGIQIGGISPLAPERKTELTRLALRAMLGGAFASWITATIAGIFL